MEVQRRNERNCNPIKSSKSNLREIPVEEAVGLPLAHDLTQIVPGCFKGPLFKKGYVITEEDLPRLLDIGKAHIYIMELSEDELHEDEAALRMATAIQGEGIELSEPHEGKVGLKSRLLGLVRIAPEFVGAVNSLGEIALATTRNNIVVKPGQQLAATRTIPLVVSVDKVKEVERLAHEYRKTSGRSAPIEVQPLSKFRVGLLTTGSEVFNGRITDKFGPVIRAKLEALGSMVAEQRYVTDDSEKIINEIVSLHQAGYDMILVTGGMSVDPDDRTPGAIKAAGTDIVSYGTPMLPGSMLLMGYLEGVPIIGLPGCVMHDPYTSFDELLPRILAGDRIVKKDITSLGYGGLLSAEGRKMS